MVVSRFLTDILELILDSDKEGDLLRSQIPFLTEKSDVEYTGVGAIYEFNHQEGIEAVRLGSKNFPLDGLEIHSQKLDVSAEAIVHVKNGYISTLEIWSKSGKYPNSELKTYTLIQVWIGSPGRQISVT
jgi:hypothetical protein